MYCYSVLSVISQCQPQYWRAALVFIPGLECLCTVTFTSACLERWMWDVRGGSWIVCLYWCSYNLKEELILCDCLRKMFLHISIFCISLLFSWLCLVDIIICHPVQWRSWLFIITWIKCSQQVKNVERNIFI